MRTQATRDAHRSAVRAMIADRDLPFDKAHYSALVDAVQEAHDQAIADGWTRDELAADGSAARAAIAKARGESEASQ